MSGAVVLLEDLTSVKELERQREEWTSVVAHDLRQPLTLMRANAELLLRLLGDEAQRSRVSQIADATRRLGQMIDDLLDVSRIEASRLSLKKAPLVVDGTQGVPIEVLVSGTPGMLTVSVRNRGEPIPGEDIPHLFDRFHRMQRSENSRVPGLGLGSAGAMRRRAPLRVRRPIAGYCTVTVSLGRYGANVLPLS